MSLDLSKLFSLVSVFLYLGGIILKNEKMSQKLYDSQCQ